MKLIKQGLDWFETARKRPVFWVGAAALLVLLIFFLKGMVKGDDNVFDYYEVKRTDFLVTIVEGGTLEAVREVVIRNEVDGNSRIIYLVSEGTVVTNGQLLVELDTAEAVDKVNQQEISFEKAKSSLIQAEKSLEIQKSEVQSLVDAAELKVEFARIDLEKFKQGERLQELRNAEIEITTATSDLLLAKDNLQWSEKLFGQGFETKNAVDQGKNNVQDLTLKLEKAQTNLWMLTNFDHPKSIRKFDSDLLEAKKELERAKAQGEGRLAQSLADFITESNSLALIAAKLQDDKEQLVKSRIYAPQDGLVVYAMVQSRYSSQTMIEEGAMVRNRQELIKLPDTSEMKVEIKIHESHVNKVRPGQAAFVVLDNLPDERFKAVVTKVAVLPDAQSRFGNPNLKVYKSEVVIRDKLPDVKPGVSARAEIVITNIPNALTVPVQAVTTLKGQTVVFGRNGSEPKSIPVEVGMFNTKQIEILSGLSEGDQVLLSPPFDAQEEDLGGAIIEKGESVPEPEPVAAEPQRPVPGLGGPGGGRRGGPDGGRRGGPGGAERGGGPDGAGGGGPGQTSPGGPGPDQAAGVEKEGRQDGQRQPGGNRPGFNREDMMKRFDKNGDGELDESEREALRKSFGGGRGRRNQTE